MLSNSLRSNSLPTDTVATTWMITWTRWPNPNTLEAALISWIHLGNSLETFLESKKQGPNGIFHQSQSFSAACHVAGLPIPETAQACQGDDHHGERRHGRGLSRLLWNPQEPICGASETLNKDLEQYKTSLLLLQGDKVRDPGGEAAIQLDADPATAWGGGNPPDHPQGAAGEADHCKALIVSKVQVPQPDHLVHRLIALLLLQNENVEGGSNLAHTSHQGVGLQGQQSSPSSANPDHSGPKHPRRAPKSTPKIHLRPPRLWRIFVTSPKLLATALLQNFHLKMKIQRFTPLSSLWNFPWANLFRVGRPFLNVVVVKSCAVCDETRFFSSIWKLKIF